MWGALYYIAAVVLITTVLVAGGVLDLWLLVRGEQTISEWLVRGNMPWFWLPAGGMAAFLVGLGIHLVLLKR